jgi:putative inorganic carbon (HCO3(-)) transporter
LLSLSVLTILLSLTASEVFLIASALLYAAHLLRHPSAPPSPPVKLPLALFCLTTLTSIGWAENPATGWIVVRKLVLFLVLLLAVNLVTTAEHLDRLYKALFVEAALAGLVAAWQLVVQYRTVRVLYPASIYDHMMLPRIHGFQGHWMHFGGQQMLMFTTLLAFLLLAPGVGAGWKAVPNHRLVRTAWWVVLAVIAVSIVLNFTRGVWLGCTVAVLYLVARWKPRWLWALPVILGLGYLAAPPIVHQRVRSALHPSADVDLAIRLQMWQVALRMIRAHPWVGVGPNNIEEVYPLYLPPGESPGTRYHDHLHNNFLQLAAERGLPCLATWVWLMAALGWHTWKLRRQLSTQRWIADATLAAWLAFLAEGCFEFNFGSSPVLLAFLFVTSTPFVAERVMLSHETQEQERVSGVAR